MKIVWQEFKLLDKSTNHSTETETIKEIINFGHDIKYYCSYKYKPIYFGLNNQTIHYFRLPRTRRIRGILFLLKLSFFNMYVGLFRKLDIVMSDYITLLVAWPSILLSRALGKKTKYILDIRTLPVEEENFKTSFRIFALSFKIACWLCDGISFITPFMKEFVLKNVKSTDLPTVIWSSGFNEDVFKPIPIENTTNNLLLFYHGGLSISRGILELMCATKCLRQEGLPVRLKLIGNIVDKEQLFDFIKKHEMQDYCDILQPVPIQKVPDLIAECDLPVIPLSNFIGWRVSSPLKLFEYLAMQKCVVLTDIEAHRAVLGNMPFAFYARSEKASDLKDAIKLAYENRKGFEEYGKLARKFVLEEFTWKTQAGRLVSFFEQITNE